jgi:hypothetical protein
VQRRALGPELAGKGGGCFTSGVARPSPGTWKQARVALLLAALAVAAAWAAGLTRTRTARREWSRPLEVAVILLSPLPREAPALARFAGSLPDLERLLGAERERHLGPGPAPFAFRLRGPIQWEDPPPLHPESDGLLGRLVHAVEAWRYLRRVQRSAGISLDAEDLVVVAWIESPAEGTAAAFAEGAGALGGETGMVRAAASGEDASLALTALAHELFHNLGATDKYDDAGHALVPSGLAEPARVPSFPQRFAEIMVGEVPLAPQRGRLPSSLEELRVGPATAREIGWILAADGRPPG